MHRYPLKSTTIETDEFLGTSCSSVALTDPKPFDDKIRNNMYTDCAYVHCRQLLVIVSKSERSRTMDVADGSTVQSD